MARDPLLGYPSPVSQQRAISRWAASRRAAEARELDELRRSPPSPSESFAAATALVGFAAARHGWPLPTGAEEAADNLAFHEIWARLRRRGAAM
jgi:hypothetical protein